MTADGGVRLRANPTDRECEVFCTGMQLGGFVAMIPSFWGPTWVTVVIGAISLLAYFAAALFTSSRNR